MIDCFMDDIDEKSMCEGARQSQQDFNYNATGGRNAMNASQRQSPTSSRMHGGMYGPPQGNFVNMSMADTSQIQNLEGSMINHESAKMLFPKREELEFASPLSQSFIRSN